MRRSKESKGGGMQRRKEGRRSYMGDEKSHHEWEV
jgi:hypothetical protein